jgi:hypothetical protein
MSIEIFNRLQEQEYFMKALHGKEITLEVI